ncbi:hypothetical protein Strain138_001733 [Pseudogemmatithrix spongiicola]|uniref:CCA tRNA nucleotidyltransferase n=1 Tax=Pseudogemmatithrix spongiicola TaxID=3062599 RepID=A0AA49K0Q9_9BACT|nr:hypothetical protein Strain138_001733 [Gemmatimonadaceae bacterium 'strain 138']WKW15349.1 hypothetical protein Strain318_001732 [Gemmatimonadaceae bacterium 'strain 318']
MLQPPAAVRAITRTLEAAGHEAWCVGGAVRDALLGIATLDWDIATSARPEQVQQLFKRTIPVGIQFGTVGVLDRDGVLHEVTTFRHDVETDGRHAVVKFGASLDEDLARRDFTINAIAVHAETLALRDPFDGRADLERRIVRCVGDAQQRMQEDRLRALRALRFAGRFDFAVDPATWQAIKDSAPHLGRLSMERVKQELEKVMEQVARPSVTLERYREAGIFAALVPALADAPRARFLAIDHLPLGRHERRVLRLAALFVEPGVRPPRTLEKTLKDLKFSNVEARAAVSLAEAAGDHRWSEVTELRDADLRRAVAKVGRLMVPSLARVLWARAKAEGATAVQANAGRALYRRALRVAFRDPLSIGDLAIDGEDLQREGVAPGKAMGDVLKQLLEVVLADPTRNTREALLAVVRARRA